MSLADLLDDGNDPTYEAMQEIAEEMRREALAFNEVRYGASQKPVEGGVRAGKLTVVTAGSGVGKSIFNEVG
jgi:hypothetical protein